MTAPADDHRTLPEQLRQVQLDVEDAYRAWQLRRELRRQLVVRTVDSGVMSQRAIARALGRGPGLVHKCLAQPPLALDGERMGE